MLQVNNTTPFPADIAIFPDENAIDTLYVVVKGGFRVGQQLQLVEEQRGFQLEDEYWADPVSSSLKYPTDGHIGKPATDIGVLGEACAPEYREVRQLDVNVQVGNVKKTVRVFGDRQWRGGRITSPVPFTSMSMVYEKAFGGEHLADDSQSATQRLSADARNPVGCGWPGEGSSRDMENVALPNLEDPARLIQSPEDKPPPAGFGFIAPYWLPRSAYAGTYDAAWQNNRAPFLPADFDRRFLNASSPGMLASGYLLGGEPVSITNMHPEGELRFVLPRVNLACRVDMAKQVHAPAFVLETVILEPNNRECWLTWRAGLPCDKKTTAINKVSISMFR